MSCAICSTAAFGARVAGLDLCPACATAPEARLGSHGIAVDSSVSMGVFSASATCAGASGELQLHCAAQGMHHVAMKLFVDELEVGDPTFDDHVYVRTSTRERAAGFLQNDGVQSAILTFLVGMRNDRFMFSHVRVEGQQLSARAIPMDGVDDAAQLAFRQAFVALALHLNG